MTLTSRTIGVLALQGAFIEHVQLLESAGKDLPVPPTVITVRTPAQLAECDGLVIPGGESSAMLLIAERTGMFQPLVEFVHSGKPCWGTCAGLIFLARKCSNGQPGQQVLGGMDIEVVRNAFGRQLDSFGADLQFDCLGKDPFHAVFIRAPVVVEASERATTEDAREITAATPPSTTAPLQVLKRLDGKQFHGHPREGMVVAVRQGNLLGTLFHPEMTTDARFHRWFLTEFVGC